MNNMTHSILVAEDEPSTRTFLTLMLRKAGYEVVACEDGAQALEALETRSFSLLLTDIVMPNMDGIELTQKALALYPTLRVLYITGFSGVESSSTKPEIHRSPIIPKPFHMNEVLEKIDKLLEKT